MAKKKINGKKTAGPLYSQVEESGKINGLALRLYWLISTYPDHTVGELSSIHLEEYGEVATSRAMSKRLSDLVRWELIKPESEAKVTCEITGRDATPWVVTGYFNPDLVTKMRKKTVVLESRVDNSKYEESHTDDGVYDVQTAPLSALPPYEESHTDDGVYDVQTAPLNALPPEVLSGDLTTVQQPADNSEVTHPIPPSFVVNVLEKLLQKHRKRPWYWRLFASWAARTNNTVTIAGLEMAIERLSK